MKKETIRIHKEVATQVSTGLAINYPLNLTLLYILIELYGVTNPLVIGTTITLIMTVIAYIRIFTIRTYFSRK